MSWPNTGGGITVTHRFSQEAALALFHGSAAYSGPPGVVTIGNFDGVHRGHQALIDAAVALERGPVVAYTFHPAPQDVLRPDRAPRRLQTLADRVARLHARGCDHVVVEPFDTSFAEQSPEEFAGLVLLERLGATGAVVGWDFRFGKGRAGDRSTLTQLLDVPVVGVDAVLVEGDPVSSSRIRKLIERGSVGPAAALLGTPHEIVGVVEPGDARGRELGFPTANLRSETPLVPGPGVYAVRASSEFGEHAGVANLGTRPTFDGDGFRIEIHLFDFSGDLYGTRLRVRFHDRVRDERSFSGIDQLVSQIRADTATARELLG